MPELASPSSAIPFPSFQYTGPKDALACQGQKTPLPLVIVTGRGSEQLAVEALKAGVSDYIIKDPGRHYLELLSLVLPNVNRFFAQFQKNVNKYLELYRNGITLNDFPRFFETLAKTMVL
jgi:FixJ family two-component response regulator